MQYLINEIKNFKNINSVTAKKHISSNYVNQINALFQNSETARRALLSCSVAESCQFFCDVRGIVSDSAVKIEGSSMNVFMRELSYAPLSLDPKSLKVFFFSLRSFAPHISGQLDTAILSDLLESFANHELTTIQLTETLYALGLLAHYHCLSGVLDSELINKIFDNITGQLINAKYASRLFSALGLLAHHGHLRSLENNELLQGIFDNVSDLEPSITEIGLVFSGLRYLVYHKIFMVPLNATRLQQLLSEYSITTESDFAGIEEKHGYIESYLLMLETIVVLADAQLVSPTVNAAQLRQVIRLLIGSILNDPENPSNDRHVAILFHAISCLTSLVKMDSEIDMYGLILELQRFFLNKKIAYGPLSLSVILFSLGLFAKNNMLCCGVSSEIIQRLLKTYLSLLPTNNEQTTLFIHSIAELARAKMIDLPIIGHDVKALFQEIISQKDERFSASELYYILDGIKLFIEAQEHNILPNPSTVEALVDRSYHGITSAKAQADIRVLCSELEAIGFFERHIERLSPESGLFSAPLSFSSLTSFSTDGSSYRKNDSFDSMPALLKK